MEFLILVDQIGQYFQHSICIGNHGLDYFGSIPDSVPGGYDDCSRCSGIAVDLFHEKLPSGQKGGNCNASDLCGVFYVSAEIM